MTWVDVLERFAASILLALSVAIAVVVLLHVGNAITARLRRPPR